MSPRWHIFMGALLLATGPLETGGARAQGPTDSPKVIRPTSGGNLVLAARDAIVHGERLRYEPEPHKNTLGYWTRKEDWCQWRFATAEAVKYEVQILQGCGKGQGGSEVALLIGKEEIAFTVEDTGHFQNFKNRTLATIELPAGDSHVLELRPRSKAAAAVMDVREVRLMRITPKP